MESRRKVLQRRNRLKRKTHGCKRTLVRTERMEQTTMCFSLETAKDRIKVSQHIMFYTGLRILRNQDFGAIFMSVLKKREWFSPFTANYMHWFLVFLLLLANWNWGFDVWLCSEGNQTDFWKAGCGFDCNCDCGRTGEYYRGILEVNSAPLSPVTIKAAPSFSDRL